MNALKNFITIGLMLLLTGGILLAPPIISGQKEEQRLHTTVQLTHIVGSRSKLSAKQIAQLYCDREIEIPYSSLHVADVRDQVGLQNVADPGLLLFGGDPSIGAPLQEAISDAHVSYCQVNSLVKIDNRPTALNFVLGNSNENPYFNVVYEEKTKTFLHFLCEDFTQDFESKEDMESYLEHIRSSMRNYYEGQLGLDPSAYHSHAEILAVTEDTPGVYTVRMHIGCGLLQEGESVFYVEEIGEKIY